MLNNNYNLEDSHLKVTGMLDRPLSLGIEFADYGIPFFYPLRCSFLLPLRQEILETLLEHVLFERGVKESQSHAPTK